MQVVPSDHFHLLKFEARKKDLSHVAGKEKKMKEHLFFMSKYIIPTKTLFFPLGRINSFREKYKFS